MVVVGSDAGATEWTVVKAKSSRRNKAKAVKAAAAAAAASGSDSEGRATTKTRTGSPSRSPNKSPGQPRSELPPVKSKQDKKPKPAGTRPPPLTTKEQMATFIARLITNSPTSMMSTAAIGERIHAETNFSWNKKFKTSFGSLRDFLESRPDLFAFVGDVVHIPSGTVKRPPSPKRVKGSVTTAPDNGLPKKPARGSRSPTKHESNKDSGHHGDEGRLVKALALVFLITAVAVFTLASIDFSALKNLLQGNGSPLRR